MTDPETEFTDLLNFLKEYLNKPIQPKTETGSLRNYYADLLNYRENDPERDSLYRTQLKILESGIFFKGGLKGKILLQTQSGQVKDRKVWPISNLKELLVKLTAVMGTTTDPEKNVKDFVSGYFENLLKAFDRAAPLARLGGVRKSSIDKTKKVLLNWKEDTIKKIPAFPKTAPNEIAEILLAHLPPQTPVLTIAERIKELLAAFNQESRKIRTLTNMVADKRKNS